MSRIYATRPYFNSSDMGTFAQGAPGRLIQYLDDSENVYSPLVITPKDNTTKELQRCHDYIVNSGKNGIIELVPGGTYTLSAWSLRMNILAEGTGYTTLTINVSAPDQVGGTQAVFNANLLNGKLNGIITVNPGKGYTVPPTVTITGNGTGASIETVLVGLSWNTGKVGLRGNGAIFDASTMTQGTAIHLRNATSPPYSKYAMSLPIESFYLRGPGDTTNSGTNNAQTNPTDGIYIGSLNGSGLGGSGSSAIPGEVAGLCIRNLLIQGFRDGLVFGDDTYINTFHNMYIGKHWRYGLYMITGNEAGENYNFHGGAIANCVNDSGTGVGIKMISDGNAIINLFGVSLDYNNYGARLDSGTLFMTGCHIEGNNQNPFVIVEPVTTTASGAAYANFTIIGSEIAPTETTGRPALFKTDVTNSAHASIVITDNKIELYDKQSDIVTFTGNPEQAVCARNFVANRGSPTGQTYPSVLGNYSARPGSYFNRLHNGAFEVNTGTGIANLNGWATSTIGTYTVAANAGTGRTGNSARIVNSGAASNLNFYQNALAVPGEQIFIDGYVSINAIAAGTVYVRLRFIDTSGAQVISNYDVLGFTATTPGYVRVSGKFTAPPGTAFARFDVYCFGFVGTIDVDDAYVAGC